MTLGERRSAHRRGYIWQHNRNAAAGAVNHRQRLDQRRINGGRRHCVKYLGSRACAHEELLDLAIEHCRDLLQRCLRVRPPSNFPLGPSVWDHLCLLIGKEIITTRLGNRLRADAHVAES